MLWFETVYIQEMQVEKKSVKRLGCWTLKRARLQTKRRSATKTGSVNESGASLFVWVECESGDETPEWTLPKKKAAQVNEREKS